MTFIKLMKASSDQVTFMPQSNKTLHRRAKRVEKYRTLVERLFAAADVRINGDRPCDIRVTNDAFFERVLLDGSLGLGEAYVDGWWDAGRIDEVMCRFARADLHRRSIRNARLLFSIARIRLSGIGRASKAFEVAERHYDLGNDLFKTMLDDRMIYSCAYWRDATTLDQAQENKLDLVCRKLALRPGLRVLEIGCGWGGWAKFAAEKYGVSVVGVTVSKEQAAYARDSCVGLPVEIRLQDYRDVNEQFDRVVSIGMFEHVGYRYHRIFMNVVNRCLKDDGVCLLHTIVGNLPVGSPEIPWITKYIFPNGEIPSLRQIMAAAEKSFVVETMHHFGTDYEQTLSVWFDNFVRNWRSIEQQYDERFFRMWTFYLLMARGFFQARAIHVWQMVLSKRSTLQRGVPDELPTNFELYDSR